MIRRRSVLGGGAALAAGSLAVGGLAQAAEKPNPLAAAFAQDGKSMKVVRVLLKNDGKTRLAEGQVGPDDSPYPLFKQFLTSKATTVAIYGAAPRHKIAGAKAPAKAMLFIAAGETVFKAGGATQRCPAGTAILVDAGSGEGLTETAGPEGYTAIKVQLAD
jgi:hypothetical protein